MTKGSETYQISLDYVRQQQLRNLHAVNVAENQEAIAAILEMMGDFGNKLEGIFECINIAEEEIAFAQEKYPNKAQEIWNSFSFLQPSQLLEPRTSSLYRAHAQEMIQRVVRYQASKQELEEATAAELCCVLSTFSQVQPLQSDTVAAYLKLFRQVFPDVPFLDEVIIQESYPGRANEIIAELRKKCRQRRQ